MKKLILELNDAHQMLSAILVSGEAVDMMAAAKSKIRKVMQTLEEKEKEGKNGG